MDKKWKKVPLAAAISAIVAAPVWADTLDVKAQSVQLSSDNYVDVDYTLEDAGNILNQSVIGGSAFGGAAGVIHSNVAAGFFNQASNQAAMGVDEDEDNTLAKTSVSAASTQGSDGENIISENDEAGDGDNTAKILGGAFAEATGIVGTNVVSGTANLQTNNVAMANATTTEELRVTASSTQKVGGLARSGADSEGNEIRNRGIDNVATVSSALNVTGVVGANVASGSANQQANSVALAKYTSISAADPTNLGATPSAIGTTFAPDADKVTAQKTTVTARANQTVDSNTIGINGSPIGAQDNSATISGTSNSAKGIVGINVAAGEANAQSNNVALANIKLSDVSDSVSATANSTQNIASNNIWHRKNGDGDTDDLNNDGDNEAMISGSGAGFRGIAGANVSAGQANAQSNNVSVALVDPDGQGPLDTVEVAATSVQTVENNTLQQGTQGQAINAASISRSFSGANGVIGANAAAGQFNAQSNQVALSNVEGWINDQFNDGISAESTQMVSGNTLTSKTDGEETLTASSTATLTGDSFNEVTGIVGANIAAGQMNAQANNVALSNVEGDADSSSALAQSTQTVSLNTSSPLEEDTLDADRSSAASIKGNFSSNVKGVVGVNVGAGQANAQANNVALTQYVEVEGDGSGSVTGFDGDITVTASSTQTVGDTNIQQAGASGYIDNDASITSSFTGGASGVVGVNVAAGQSNAQANNVAIVAYAGDKANNFVAAKASSIQNTTNNAVTVAKTVDEESVSDEIWPIDNDAAINNSFTTKKVSGVTQVSVASGQNNAQANNTAISAIKAGTSAGGKSATHASSVQNLVNNDVTSDVTDDLNANAFAVSNNAQISGSFSEVSGIAGVNVASGQANAQANNVVLSNSGARGYTPISDAVSLTTLSSEPSTIGTLASNKQEIDGGQIDLSGVNSEAENRATVANSFAKSTGIVGANVAAGQSNAQSNNVAFNADTDPLDNSGTAVTAAVSLQEFDEVNATLGAGFDNQAELTGSFNSGTDGIVGVNVAAGQANAQTNNVAVSASGESTASVALAGNAQIIGAQLNTDNSDDNGTSNSMLVVNNSFDNSAVLTNSFNGAKGILGVNIASGQLNGQANNVAVALSESSDSLTGTLNVQVGVINEVQYTAQGSYTATLGSGAFEGAKGVIGTNVAVGVANGQSNNVALQVSSVDSQGSVVAASAQGNFANGMQGDESGALDMTDFDSLSVENAQLAHFAVNDSGSSNSSIQSVGNTSTLSGNAFSGAKGIIGVNIATGMGNLQSNNVTLIAKN